MKTRTLPLGFLLTVCLGLTFGQKATSPAQSQTLKLNQPIEKQIKAGKTQEFQIALKAGGFMQVEAMQKGVDVVLKLYAPDGQMLLERDSPNTTEGPEPLSYLAATTGTYKLAVSVWEQANKREGSYAIELRALRKPTPQDHQRIAAEVLFREAFLLGEQGRALRTGKKPDEAKKVIDQAQAKYGEILPFWRELGEKYWEALTLVQINSVESLEEAAKVYEEMGDKKRAQNVWVAVARIYYDSKKWEQVYESLEKMLVIARERNDTNDTRHLLREIEQLGQLYMSLGELAKAKEIFQKVFQSAKEIGDVERALACSQNLERISKNLIAKGPKAELVVETGHSSSVFSVAFSPDGKTLATSGGFDRNIILWDIASGTQLRTLSGHTRHVTFSPDGKTLASGSKNDIKLWDIASGTEIKSLSGGGSPVAFSPDGKTLASGSAFYTIKLWDVATGTEFRTFFGHKESVTSVAFSPNGKTLASSSFDKTIKLWDATSGTELRTISGAASFLSVAFSPDGRTLASGSHDHTAKLWDVASGTEIRTFSGHKGAVHSVAFSPDGKTLASGGDTNFGDLNAQSTIKLWDVMSGSELYSLSSGVVYSVAFSPDGKILASGNAGTPNIHLWDVTSGTKLRTFRSTPPVESFTLASDGKTVASVSHSTIKLWDITSGTRIRILSHRFSVLSVTFAPDSKTLASSSADETIKLWDVASGTEIRTFSGHTRAVHSVAFSPDGRIVASGSEDKTIRFWDTASGTEIRTLSLPSTPYSVTFSPDGRTLASGSYEASASGREERKIKLWDVTTGKELLLPNSLPKWATPRDEFALKDKFALQKINDEMILIANEIGQINLINYDTGERLCSLIALALDKDDWVVVTPDGLFDATPGAMKLMHFVISGIEEGSAVVALEQMKDRYYQPNLLAKLLGYDNTPIKEIPPFTGEKLFPKLEFKRQEKDSTKLEINLHNRGGGIGEVAVLVNGKTYIQDARPAGFNPNAKDATLIVDLKDAPFLAGVPNQIEVIARNAEGWLTSPRSSSLVYTVESAAAKPDAELWAIVGGVSDYEGTQLDLNFAAKDAEDFANAIKLGSYHLFGANRVHLQTLTTNNKDPKLLPTKENFRRVFTEFQKAKPNDVLLVYLSGHGVAFRVNGDKVIYNYLTQAATNGDVKDSDVRSKVAITSDELMEWIRLIPTNKNVLVFDTCAAGAFADNLNLALKKDEAGENLDNQKIAMEDLKYRMGFHILMGAAADKPSYETSQFNQGLLTYALLEGVKFGAVNDKKIVNVSELFQYARNRVPKLAESIGNVNIQTPQIAAPQGETFPLLQMTVNESELIHLEQERPIIMRPRLVNEDDRFDEELEKALIRQLKAASQPVKRGVAARSSPLVFLENWELPSAIKPYGSYKYEGEQVTVTIELRRNKQPVGTFRVTGTKNDVPGFVEKIIAELVVAIGKMPKAAVGGAK